MILVLNAGSSSIKHSLFNELRLVDKGIEERIGLPGGPKDHSEAIRKIFDKLIQTGKIKDLAEIEAVGHRVVHGGEEFREPTVLDEKIIEKLKGYSKLAPLHNPPNIFGIETCRKLLPKAMNVAVFDTAFYASLPEESYIYTLPYEYYTKHKIRRYGFHGISHEYVADQAEKILGKKISRLITCHLGAGSSITAIKDGKPIDTSMGFTPIEGLPMESRSGNIDPAIPLYLISELKMKAEEVYDILNQKSGYFGVCGLKDFREILASKNELPRLAYQIYLKSVVKYIGSYIAILQGIDAVVFTAGIGEGSAKFRKDVMSHFEFLGAKIDEEKNEKNEEIISAANSEIQILMIPTDEMKKIAEATYKLI